MKGKWTREARSLAHLPGFYPSVEPLEAGAGKLSDQSSASCNSRTGTLVFLSIAELNAHPVTAPAKQEACQPIENPLPTGLLHQSRGLSVVSDVRMIGRCCPTTVRYALLMGRDTRQC
jgi:hypothetical protein